MQPHPMPNNSHNNWTPEAERLVAELEALIAAAATKRAAAYEAWARKLAFGQ